MIAQAIEDLPDIVAAPELASVRVSVERTRDSRHGDFASNIAMRLAKSAGRNPRELAQLIIDKLPRSAMVDKVDIAGPGFINFFVGEAAFHEVIVAILGAG